MASPIQEQQDNHLHRDGQSHPLPLWVRWLIVLFVLFVVIGGSVLWIIQGVRAIIPIAVLTALGILIAFSQVLPWLFPSIRHGHSVTSSKQTLPPDITEISQNLPLKTISQREPDAKDITISKPKIDWGQAPQLENFYGREQELTELEHWIVDDRCQVVAVLGMGGMGKTSLATTLAERLEDECEYVFWRDLKNAPPLENILKTCIQFFSNHERIDLPEDIDEQIALLVQYLRDHRCLLVLDNLETVLQAGNRVGQYQVGHESYGQLIRRVGETRHRSCLLLTSREKPGEVALLEGEASLVRSYQLAGLQATEGRKILRDKGLHGEEETWNALINGYTGNPLALKLVSQFIREVFDGNIASFLKDGKVIFSDILDVLDQQFERLSALEQEIMYWLAIEREALSLDEVPKNLVRAVSKQELHEAFRSLRRRYLVETSARGITLQNVVMEYITDQLIDRLCKEIASEELSLFESHALIKAQAKDYVRESQIRLVLAPVAQWLLTNIGKEGIEKKFKSILSSLREMRPHSRGYAAGNVLNLLVHLGCDLHGYDFSHLSIWQAYLQDVTLHDVNFAYSDFAKAVFTKNFGDALSVEFSPNGQLLAGGTDNGDIWIWQVPASKPLLFLQGHADWVRSVTFSPHGSLLASGGDDQTVRLWDVSTGQCLQTLQGHTDWVFSVAFSADGKVLASGSNDQTIRLWDVSTGQCLHILQGHTNRVRSVAFSPDGSIVASASEDQSIRLWQVSTGDCFHILQGHSNWVRSIAFNPDGKVLASGSSDQTIRLWQVGTGHCLQILQGHTGWVRSIAFSPDGTMLASGSDDQSVRLWDISTGECFRILQAHTYWIRSVAFSPDGTIVASGSQDQRVRLWQVSTGQCLQTLRCYTHWIRSVTFSLDGTMLASCGDDESVRLWQVRTGECCKILQGHTHWVHSVAFSPDSMVLVSGSEDESLRLWQASTGQCLQTLRGHTDLVWTVAFSPGGQTIASGSHDQTVRLWDVNTGQCIHTLQGHNKRVHTLAFNSEGNIIASGSDDQTIRLWDVNTGQCFKILQGHINQVWSVAFSPDGKIIASGSEDRTIRLWDVSTGQCFKILQGLTSWVRSVAFSPDGRILASGSDDQAIRFWDIDTGQCLKTLQGHTSWVYSVAFSRNGTTIASGSRDGTIKLWNVQSGECLRTLRIDRPYERMNITGVTGLNDAEKAMLKALGAIEDES